MTPADGGVDAPEESRSGRCRHILTVNVEEYFHAAAFDDLISPQEWELYPARIERSLDRIFEVLGRHGASATFFVLRWVAERYPDLVRRIVDLGHEVACQGRGHRSLSERDRDALTEHARRFRRVLEETTGSRVHGYRASGFAADGKEGWFFDVLIDTGFTYDSSCLSQAQLGAGSDERGGAACRLLRRPGGTLLEVPLPSFSWLGVDVGALGGSTLRHLPYAVIERTLEEYSERGESAGVLLRSWEVDPGQPRLPASNPLAGISHYWGLERTMERLDRLLARYPFTSVRNRFRLG